MTEAFDFDSVLDRRDSGSYKWDSHGDTRDTIEMWVADMDFKTAPCVIDALERRVMHGAFGYTFVGDEYYNALTDWFSNRHGYTIDRSKVIYTSGVVPAISAIIKALAKPGDGVMLNTPAYNCFFSSIRNNGCRVVASPLLRQDMPDGGFRYIFDFDSIEKLAAQPANKLLILCNPHNPTGRVWTVDELQRLNEICRRNDIRVISDEIHCELTLPSYEYVPYGNIDDNAVVCNSPSKAFNTAGLQIANIVTPDESVRKAVDRAININEVCDVNPFGVVGLVAAYRHGGPWLDALRQYLADNYKILCEFFAEYLPQYPVCRLEATYLVWVDITAANRFGDSIEQYLASDYHVRIANGDIYGDGHYIRINIATPRSQLIEGLRRIAEGLSRL